MKDETDGVIIKECVGLKPKIYSFLVNDNNEHKEEKGVNRNDFARISHVEYKDVLLKKKWLRYSLNRVESKSYKIGSYIAQKISFPLRISSVNMTKSAGNCGFGHIN